MGTWTEKEPITPESGQSQTSAARTFSAKLKTV